MVNKKDVKNNGKTANNRKFKYLEFEKLIRDKNPELHAKCGGECFYCVLSREDFIKSLKLKLVEEAQEVIDAKTKEEATDELGDVIEVLKALIRTAKISRFKIWNARRKKAKQRGRFKKGVYCNYVKYPVNIVEKWMWKYKDITDVVEQKQQKNSKKKHVRKVKVQPAVAKTHTLKIVNNKQNIKAKQKQIKGHNNKKGKK